jgi:hypothetical protein
VIPQAAADGPATQLSRAAFNAILNGEQPALSELATSTGVSSQEVELLVGRALIIDESAKSWLRMACQRCQRDSTA